MAAGHSNIPPFPDDIDRRAFGAWLSGFTDAEASFILRINPDKREGREGRSFCIAYYRITLRADDRKILETIRSFWQCGTLHHAKAHPNVRNAKPTTVYNIARIADLMETVIPHFEAYPIFSKKRRDFAIWRKGVGLIAEVQGRRWRHRPGAWPSRHGGYQYRWMESDVQEFRSLSEQLIAQRRFDGPPSPPDESPPARRDGDGPRLPGFDDI